MLTQIRNQEMRAAVQRAYLVARLVRRIQIAHLTGQLTTAECTYACKSISGLYKETTPC